MIEWLWGIRPSLSNSRTYRLTLSWDWLVPSLKKSCLGLTSKHAALKRRFDIFLSLVGLVLTFWFIAIAWCIACVDTRRNGFFVQDRVGLDGKIFKIIKIRSMRDLKGVTTNVTTRNDPRVTRIGKFWRETKIDALPHLFNILMGDMSFVGPTPDVPGYADKLEGLDRIILTVRPGMTGPASLMYRNEEHLLATWDDPERFNDEFIWPRKVKINRRYVMYWSFKKDLMYLWKGVKG